MPFNNLLDIPEIFFLVAGFLEKSDHVNCLLVAKTWHVQFMPFVWKQTTVQTAQTPEETPVDPEAKASQKERLMHHRHLVQELHIHNENMDEFTIKFPNLRLLRFVLHLDCKALPQYNPMGFLILNPWIVNINIQSSRALPVELYEVISELPSLKHFSLSGKGMLDMHGKLSVDGSCLWRIFHGLESLTLSHLFFSENIKYPDDIVFPEMRELRLDLVWGLKSSGQLQLIQRCPRIKKLFWNGSAISEGPEFVQCISLGAWPRLQKLILHEYFKDDDLARIIDGIWYLTELGLPQRILGPRSTKSLRRHFDHLAKFYIHGHDTGSEILREMLCSCPNLLVLSGGRIQAKDMLDDGPWVCQLLQVLDVDFHVDEGSDESIWAWSMVIERTSELPRLRERSGV